MGQSAAKLESGKDTHVVCGVRMAGTVNKSKVTTVTAKQMQPDLLSLDHQNKDDQSFFLPADIQTESELLDQEVVQSDLMGIDLDDMIDSLSIPELLSPLSSVVSESGCDSCSSFADASNLSSDSGSLTDLFPDLALGSNFLLA